MGTVRVAEIEVSAEDDIGTVRIAAIGVEADAVEQSGTVRVAGIGVETDAHVVGTFQVARVTVDTGEVPDQLPSWFWGGGSRTWRPRSAYSGLTGTWT